MTRDIGARFRALHRKGDPFVLANAWDAGSAKMLAGLGAEAIGTSSAAHAFTLGRGDGGSVTRDEALAHAQTLVAAVNLPVSGDFENGFGDDPDTLAETVRLAHEVGLAGISIKDTAFPGKAPYARALATERIRAAVAAARALPGDFVLCARADGVMNGQYDFNEALERLLAFEAVGADCLYAPVPGTLEEQAHLCKVLKRPVNVLATGAFARVPRDEFARIGAARISLGSGLARATHRVIADIGVQILDSGDFSGLGDTIAGAAVETLFRRAGDPR